jgi:hypothetical protein
LSDRDLDYDLFNAAFGRPDTLQWASVFTAWSWPAENPCTAARGDRKWSREVRTSEHGSLVRLRNTTFISPTGSFGLLKRRGGRSFFALRSASCLVSLLPNNHSCLLHELNSQVLVAHTTADHTRNQRKGAPNAESGGSRFALLPFPPCYNILTMEFLIVQ